MCISTSPQYVTGYNYAFTFVDNVRFNPAYRIYLYNSAAAMGAHTCISYPTIYQMYFCALRYDMDDPTVMMIEFQTSVLLMELICPTGGLKYFIMAVGVQYVTMMLTNMLLIPSVDSWDIGRFSAYASTCVHLIPYFRRYISCWIIFVSYSHSDSFHFTGKPTPTTAVLTMARELVKSGLTVSRVLTELILLLTAQVGHGVSTIVITLMTLLSVAQYHPKEVNVN